MSQALRFGAILSALMIGFAGVGYRLISLAIEGENRPRLAVSAPVSESLNRPAILDRHGNILAIDILLPSLFADPSRMVDRRDAIDRLRPVLPPADAQRLEQRLANPNTRFTWISRKVSTALLERVRELGIPSVDHRWETKRTYPAGTIAGHVIGAVDIENRGISGLERHLDSISGQRIARDEGAGARPPLRASLSIAVQHATEEVLAAAVRRYHARAASAVILDSETGEVYASASWPEVDPAFPETWIVDGPIDHAGGGVFELGSIYKVLTIAMGLERGDVTIETAVDAHIPIELPGVRLADRATPNPLSVRDVMLRSSNVGAARIALEAGAEAHFAFLAKLRMAGPIETELGLMPKPIYPRPWRSPESVMASFGYGLAVAPIQFAAAVATLVNGGYLVTPTFVAEGGTPRAARKQVLDPEVSRTMRSLFRDTVRHGTGRLAGVPGYDLGGKTGTAQILGPNGRRGPEVLSSFVAVLPADAPRLITLVTLHAPQATTGTGATANAADTAAPVTAELIARIAPQLGVLPQ
ncbi:MAG: peptidoglycan D,D-transpeptidase FtsI family protein [Hyphomicrobiaceae bacterium]